MTTNGQRETTLTSFCASCGKPVRWCVRASDKSRNDEFCPDCEPYAAQIVQIEMKIEALHHRMTSKAEQVAAELQIEQHIKDRDMRVRILDTIRIGMQNEFIDMTEKNYHFRLNKFAKN